MAPHWRAAATGVVVALCVASVSPLAIDLHLTTADLERAVALARFPHSDDERAQFHRRYVVAVNAPPIDGWAAGQVEVITPFRRVEMMAEEHRRLNDLWGRGGVKDVEEAIRPWRGRVSIVAHLTLRPGMGYVAGVPPIEVVVGGPGRVPALDVRRTPLSNCPGDMAGCALTGGLVEAIFDATALGRSPRPVTVVSPDGRLARTTIDFGAIE
ncbi:MAG: hypothetical protein ACM3SQ_16160 [Betaproteobacteria bacterium]